MKNKKGFLGMIWVVGFIVLAILILSIMFYSKVSSILGYFMDNWWLLIVLGAILFFRAQVAAILNAILGKVGVRV